MKPVKIVDANNSYVPSSYEDMYLYYFVGRKNGVKSGSSLCKSLLKSILPYTDDSERESLMHDVFIRMKTHNILEKFDPAQANFGGMVFVTARSVAVNYLDKRTRNPVTGLNGGSINQSSADDFEVGTVRLDKIFSTLPSTSEAKLDASRKVAKLFEFAREKFQNPQCVRDKNLLFLLKFMMEENDPRDCAPILGVSPSTIYNWMTYLKEILLQMA